MHGILQIDNGSLWVSVPGSAVKIASAKDTALHVHKSGSLPRWRRLDNGIYHIVGGTSLCFPGVVGEALGPPLASFYHFPLLQLPYHKYLCSIH